MAGQAGDQYPGPTQQKKLIVQKILERQMSNGISGLHGELTYSVALLALTLPSGRLVKDRSRYRCKIIITISFG